MPIILVVDDEEPNRQLLRVLLEHDGHDVLEAASGERALELLAEHEPNLMIVDLYMPGMKGSELIKRVRALSGMTRKTRIALYTGSEATELIRDFMELMDVEAIIPKPGEPQEIIDAVRAALA